MQHTKPSLITAAMFRPSGKRKPLPKPTQIRRKRTKAEKLYDGPTGSGVSIEAVVRRGWTGHRRA
ncbi:MAG: hypothetical protein WBX25_29955 [Rhodomicrobium sp.]